MNIRIYESFFILYYSFTFTVITNPPLDSKPKQVFDAGIGLTLSFLNNAQVQCILLLCCMRKLRIKIAYVARSQGANISFSIPYVYAYLARHYKTHFHICA